MSLWKLNVEESTFDRRLLRALMIIIATAVVLYLVYLLRKPIMWLVLASVLAIAASGPVNWLSRRIKRGTSIAIVYLGILLVPAALGAVLLPPIVSSGVDLARDLPTYVRDFRDTLQKSESFRKLDENFNINEKLTDAANNIAGDFDSAAGVLGDLGAGALNSIFAGITILVLSMFMVSRGRKWVNDTIDARAGPGAESLHRTVDRIARAVSGFIIGAFAQALVAGLAAFIVLSILGIPSPLALAVVIALFDLIPLVGSTIGAAVVAVVTLFADFPIDPIIWVAFSIAYQQFENYVIQPQIQKRAVALDPFVVLVAVIFGGSLMGILGAVMAIPIAATIQIAIQEYRRFAHGGESGRSQSGPPATSATPA